MDAYRVSARIDRGAPHRWQPLRGSADAPLDDVALAPVDLVGRPLEVALAERWDAIRERWSQATFFLFDADSWRT
jgi:hypothetical protein